MKNPISPWHAKYERLVSRWLAERCVSGPRRASGCRTLADDLYRDFSSWLAERDTAALSQASFGRMLTARGIVRLKSGVVFRYPIRLRSSAAAEAEAA